MSLKKMMKGLNIEEIQRRANLHDKIAIKTLEIIEEMRQKQLENEKKLKQIMDWLKLAYN